MKFVEELVELVVNGSDAKDLIDSLYEASKSFKVGDIVQYNSKWLKNTGQNTGDAPQKVGKIIALKQLSGNHVKVQWAGEKEPMIVHPVNLQASKKPFKG